MHTGNRTATSTTRDREDPATTHARLTAAAIAAERLNDPRRRRRLPRRNERLERIDQARGTAPEQGRRRRQDRDAARRRPDEERFRTPEAWREHVRGLVLAVCVRRNGWTVADPRQPLLEPDGARLLLLRGDPVVDVVAAVAMDGSLDEARLRHSRAGGEMTAFDHAAHDVSAAGVRYLAELFRIRLPAR